MNIKQQILNTFGFNKSIKKPIYARLNALEENYRELIKTAKDLSIVVKNPSAEDVKLSKEDLLKFSINKWHRLAPGVLVRRRNNHFPDPDNPDQEIYNFDTIMEKNSEFGRHFHDDVLESCEVIEGCIVNKANNQRYTRGMIVLFKKLEMHDITAPKYALLKVLFKV